MNLLDQLTTPETSRELIKAGMPIPEPAIGQVWLNKTDGSLAFIWDVKTNVRLLSENSQHFMSINDFLEIHTPAFTAPEILAWAGERFVLWFDESPRINQYCACRTCDSIADSTEPCLHPNPAEAIAQAVIKAMS